MRASKVYTAFFADLSVNWQNNGWSGGACSPNRDSRMRVGRFDWDSDSLGFYTESN
jgi:hypothetical protein